MINSSGTVCNLRWKGRQEDIDYFIIYNQKMFA